LQERQFVALFSQVLQFILQVLQTLSTSTYSPERQHFPIKLKLFKIKLPEQVTQFISLMHVKQFESQSKHKKAVIESKY